jgi:hypothetical protein
MAVEMALATTMATETQFHVLAVDDCLIDRKLIERLLKTSSYQGTTTAMYMYVEAQRVSWIIYYFDLGFLIADNFFGFGSFLQSRQWIQEARPWSFWA